MVDWTLALDFGTTFTVGAVAERGRVTLVNIDGESRMPSAVWMGDDGRLVVGAGAVHQAVFAPDRFESTPKRSIGEGEIALGDRLIPLTEVVGAVLARIAEEASRVHGGTAPREVRITHPATWADVRLRVLTDAASIGELPAPKLIPEPVAAALRIGAKRIKCDQHVAVYDFGGGTFDAAIVRRTRAGFEVTGPPGGRDPLGGEDIDRRILEYLAEGPIGKRPEWESLVHPPDVHWRREAVQLRTEIRKAKEGLSRATSWQLWVPGVQTEHQLSRAELERLVNDDIDATLEILERTIADAGLQASELAGIFLVGGSSRMPIVADSIWRRFGRRPDVEEDPKAVVAIGAAEWTPERRPRGARFRSRLAMATVLPLWRERAAAYGRLVLSGDGLVVQIDDAPAGEADASELARGADEVWTSTAGYAEGELVSSTVLGVEDGLERTLVSLENGREVRWLERYAVSDGRAIVVTAHEQARPIADAVTLGRPAFDAAKHYEMRLVVDLPDGWRAVERVELVRSSSGHRLTAEGFPVEPGTKTEQWAHRQALSLSDGNASLEGPKRAKAFGRGDAVTYSFTSGDGVVTRAWMLVVDRRGYMLTASLPELEAIGGFRLLVGHAILAQAAA